MLLAKNKEGEITSLITLSKDELELHRKTSFYCPCCQGRVYVKAGRIKIPHFAHASYETCDFATEGESQEHLQGKKQLYEWLIEQGLDVEIEKYFPQFKQRADLYFESRGKKYAIEFQCSIITLEDIKRRTQMYFHHHITPIWILNSRLLKSKYQNEYALTPFQWYVSSGSKLAPRLLSYSPSQRQFTILKQLTPFSSRLTISFPQIFQQKHLSFSQLFQESVIYPLAHHQWMARKQLWRMNTATYSTFYQAFHEAMYSAKLYPATFPNEIGIPVPYMHMYETNSIQWQFWLYDKVIKQKMPGDIIQFQEWKSTLIQCIKERKIVLRLLPFFNSNNPFLPLEQYIVMLEKLGVITRVTDGTYKLSRKFEAYNPAFPKLEVAFYEKVRFIYDELMKSESYS